MAAGRKILGRRFDSVVGYHYQIILSFHVTPRSQRSVTWNLSANETTAGKSRLLVESTAVFPKASLVNPTRRGGPLNKRL